MIVRMTLAVAEIKSAASLTARKYVMIQSQRNQATVQLWILTFRRDAYGHRKLMIVRMTLDVAEIKSAASLTARKFVMIQSHQNEDIVQSWILTFRRDASIRRCQMNVRWTMAAAEIKSAASLTARKFAMIQSNELIKNKKILHGKHVCY